MTTKRWLFVSAVLAFVSSLGLVGLSVTTYLPEFVVWVCFAGILSGIFGMAYNGLFILFSRKQKRDKAGALR
jgi:H+/Cl- antiporter ClcA